jgi:hypothetical protein
VIAQAVPFPFAVTLPLVTGTEAMKQYAPQSPCRSHPGGFVRARSPSGVQRAEESTREKVLNALNSMVNTTWAALRALLAEGEARLGPGRPPAIRTERQAIG